MLLHLLLLFYTLTVVENLDCNFCQEICYPTNASSSALCKCDVDCQVFGDCCCASVLTPPSKTEALQPGVKLDCVSTYLNPDIQVLAENKGFLMISTCPDSWMEMEDGATADFCISSNTSTVLPPVTSTATGMVYKNEFCALCNGVSELVTWQTDFFCNSIVYELLFFNNVSDIMLISDILERYCRECSFQVPAITKVTQNYTRSCIPSVSICLPFIELEELTVGNISYTDIEQNCVAGVLNLVRSSTSGVVYRNAACAICNNEEKRECLMLEKTVGIPSQCLPNYSNTTISTDIPTQSTSTTFPFPKDNLTGTDPPIEGPPTFFFFTITLSNLGGGGLSISSERDGSSVSIDCVEGEARVGLECRPTLCPNGFTLTGGRCAVITPTHNPPSFNSTLGNCSTEILVLNKTDCIDFGNDTIISIEDESMLIVMDYDEMGCPIFCIKNVSDNTPYLDCLTALVPLNITEYIDIGNGTILYENVTVMVMFYDEYGRPLVCPSNTTSTNIFSSQLLPQLPGLQELSYIGCSLSILGTTMVLVTYTLFSELRTLPGLILMNLCIPIFAINFLFITLSPTLQSFPVRELCSTVAVALHFFYLVQFSWMSIFSCEMVRNFYQARKLLTDSKKTKQKLFVSYMFIGWCLSVVIITISITLNLSVEGWILYGVDSDGNISLCWINHFVSSILIFLVPLVLCFSCNLLMFLLTTFLLFSNRSTSTSQKCNTFTLIRVWLAMFSTTALTWIFGFLAISSQLYWMWYPFVIFNSVQGFSIFLAFLFTKKILRLYYSLARHRKNTIITQQGTM